MAYDVNARGVEMKRDNVKKIMDGGFKWKARTEL